MSHTQVRGYSQAETEKETMANERAKALVLKALEEKGTVTTRELYRAVHPGLEKTLSQGELLSVLNEMERSGSIRSSVDKRASVLVWELATR